MELHATARRPSRQFALVLMGFLIISIIILTAFWQASSKMKGMIAPCAPPTKAQPDLLFVSGGQAQDQCLGGHSRWRYSLPPAAQTTMQSDGPLLLLAQPQHIIALDRMTGQEQWQSILTDPLMANPILASTMILVGTSSAQQVQLTAFDRQAGHPQWTYTLARASGHSYTLCSDVLAGQTLIVYASETSWGLISLNNQSGVTRWKSPPFIGSLREQNCFHGIAYVRVNFGPAPQGEMIAAIQMQDGHMLWQTDLPAEESGLQMQAGSKHISVITGDMALFLDTQTGSITARVPVGSPPPGGDVVIHNDSVYRYDHDQNRLAAYQGSDGALQWTTMVAPNTPGENGPVLATDDAVIVQTSHDLYAFASADGKSLWSYHADSYIQVKSTCATSLLAVIDPFGQQTLPSVGIWQSRDRTVINQIATTKGIEQALIDPC